MLGSLGTASFGGDLGMVGHCIWSRPELTRIPIALQRPVQEAQPVFGTRALQTLALYDYPKDWMCPGTEALLAAAAWNYAWEVCWLINDRKPAAVGVWDSCFTWVPLCSHES